MRDAARTAEHLPVHLAPAGAGVDQTGLPCFQRGCGQHRLEHRPHRVALEGPVQHRAVRRIQAGSRVCRVVPRHTDAGADFGVCGIQHHDAASGHHPARNGFRRPLDRPGKSQLDPHGPAVGVGLFRLAPQASLRIDKAGQSVALPGAGKRRIKRGFQPGGSPAVAVHIPDELHSQRRGRIAHGHRPAGNAQRRNIAVHREQERRDCVSFLVQQRLPSRIGTGKEPGIVSPAGHTERHPLCAKARQKMALAVVEIAPPRRECQRHHALRRRAGCIVRVGAQPVQPADHRRKTPHQQRIQRQHPPSGHENAPFGLLKQCGPDRGC